MAAKLKLSGSKEAAPRASAVVQYATKLELQLHQAKALNAIKGSLLADLLEAEARVSAERGGEAAATAAVAAVEVRDALASTQRELDALRIARATALRELRDADESLHATRLRLAREQHFARHGDPRLLELQSALAASEGLESEATKGAAGAIRAAHMARSDPPRALDDEPFGPERARLALERACAALGASCGGAARLRDVMLADLEQADRLSGQGREHRRRERPSARADEPEGTVSLRKELALATADVNACERWFGQDAAHHAALAQQVDALEALEEERAGWLARLRLDARELTLAARHALEPDPTSDEAREGPLALLRALAAPNPTAQGIAALATGPPLGEDDLARRKEALLRVRERSASVQAYADQAERHAREAESALLVGLRKYAAHARAAHGACARMQALDELWAEGAHGRLQLEAQLSESIGDLLARAPLGVPDAAGSHGVEPATGLAAPDDRPRNVVRSSARRASGARAAPSPGPVREGVTPPPGGLGGWSALMVDVDNQVADACRAVAFARHGSGSPQPDDDHHDDDMGRL
jgi:hypothetical protein